MKVQSFWRGCRAACFLRLRWRRVPSLRPISLPAQVKAVNALPGIDRQIVNTDVGNTNLAVGIIHRGKTGAPPAAGAGGGGRPPRRVAARQRQRRPSRVAKPVPHQPDRSAAAFGIRARPRPTSSCPARARS